VTPVKDGSGDVAEYHAGLATVSSFSEAVGVGGVAKVTFNCDGYGAMAWTPQGVGSGVLANDLSSRTSQKLGPVANNPDAIGKKI
jgi:deoxyinosine 3'endonuclease (endonuclease V)